jgi:DNA-binding transcriptional ArsR family regulator
MPSTTHPFATPAVQQPSAPPAASRALELLPGSDGGVEMVAKFFRALGDPARLRLLEFLLREEHTVTECVDRIGLSQGRVSAHLACLADCGYVQVRRAGRFAHYRVADPRVADLVMLARSLAADNAAAQSDCVRIAPAGHGTAAVPGPIPAIQAGGDPGAAGRP